MKIRLPRRLFPILPFAVLPLPAASLLAGAEPVPAQPVPPGMFTLSDPDLEVTVWAQSPMLHNPTNIDIDKDGCIWVAEGVNYRMHFNRQPEGDRIMVLQDTDGDGKADKSWPFVQEKFLRAPLGVAVIGNKVVVSMAPDLVVYTDKDGDKKFDPAKGDTREVLLTGFNGRNHDHSLHSVTVGPDGKWYFSAGNCGAKFTDKSGKTFRIGSKQNISWWPKDPEMADGDPNEYAGQKSDDGKVYIGGFIARMNPDGTSVEILAHNLRNSYENCVTSYGDIFASDNDDQPACRVFGVLEGGNYGFASADGSRTWQADRRPGQDVKTATWRQEDPGVAPAGDVYGGGAPTGCVFYENGALGEKNEGTLLVCESALNTIFGYKPEKDGAGWKLERFDFLTTNREKKVIGTDSTGGNQSAKSDDTKTLFRPSDIAVGPDGAIYISDWFDPRTGGHADIDDSVSGTIYRVAPKGFKAVVPKVDLTTVDGAIEALKSPAVNVRAQGAEALRNLKPSSIKSLELMAGAGDSVFASRAGEVLFQLSGDPFSGIKKNGNERAAQQTLAKRMAELAGKENGILKKPPALARADNPSTIRTVLTALDRNPATRAEDMMEVIELTMVGDPVIDIAYGNAARNVIVQLAEILRKQGAFRSGEGVSWPAAAVALMFQLHPPQSIPAFKTRALSSTLPLKARKDALTAIGFNTNAEAAQAMLEIAEKTGVSATTASSSAGGGTDPGTAAPAVGGGASPDFTIHDLALWWLLNKKDNAWKDHGLAAALKTKGIYDPDSITLAAVSLPDPPPAAFPVAEALKLAGDATRGQGISQRCYMCHRIGENGADFGPELTTWGHTQGVEVILRSIIEPSADIAHGFEGVRLETTDGLTIDGILLTESDPVIIRSMGGLTQTVPQARIKSRKPLHRSLMMSATQLGLTPQDCADLAAFLRK